MAAWVQVSPSPVKPQGPGHGLPGSLGGQDREWGVASSSESNGDWRERLLQLALETTDINKDPYFLENHLGSSECKLCPTLPNNEGCCLAHTQGKKQQTNLAREPQGGPAQPAPEKVKVEV